MLGCWLDIKCQCRLAYLGIVVLNWNHTLSHLSKDSSWNNNLQRVGCVSKYVIITHYQKVYAWHQLLCFACSIVAVSSRLRCRKFIDKLFKQYLIICSWHVWELLKHAVSYIIYTTAALVRVLSLPCVWFPLSVELHAVSHVGQGAIEYTVLVVEVFSLLEYDDTSLCDWCKSAVVIFIGRILNLWDVWQPLRRSHVPEEWLPLRNTSNSPVSN